MTAGQTGLEGEDAAARYLEDKGWTIRDRRFRARTGEIDLVAERAGEVVFAEVKTRRRGAVDDGRGAVTAGKRRRLARAAALYIARHGLAENRCRFDVLTVSVGPGGRLDITHLEGAFDAG
ncbi:MAG: YraN family protein [Acidobacteriota bacterium]